MAHTDKQPLWGLESITKSFPGVRANDNVSLKLYPGEIHGLLGANGSGKSTLIKILSGVHRPDGGTIRLNGVEVNLENPTVARSKGVSTVFQEFSLVPGLSVAENVFLGQHLLKLRAFVDWARMRRETERVLSELEIEIDPAREVGDLSTAEQQLVEIAKAITQEAKMLILDEPTAALGEHEIIALHDLLRRMKNRGVSILYISHRLDEVVSLVDTITVLKDGKVVSTAEESTLDVNDIVAKMVGRQVEQHYPKERNSTNERMLEVRNLSSAGGVKNASFDVCRGEVFGLGGVIGSGRTEMARALFGIDRLTGGEILFKGRRLDPRSPRDSIGAGLGLIPENRKTDGLFFNFTGAPNTSSASLRKIVRHLLLDRSEEDHIFAKYVSDLEIEVSSLEQMVLHLSGGNQQKVVIARWLFADSELLILDEPTQGIDIAAKVAVYNLINRLTSQGRAVILISSDHDELISMSDRIGIVRKGTIVEIRDAVDITEGDLMKGSANELLSSTVG
jgi:ribose transport system ATP-binding protein